MSSIINIILLAAAIGSVSSSDANQKLRACCDKQTKADAECRRDYCNFGVLKKENVLQILATCSQRGNTIGDMWDCASSLVDHTPCCLAQGITGPCLEFCSTQDGVPLDTQFLFCVVYFDNLMSCFRNHLNEHPSIKGDV